MVRKAEVEMFQVCSSLKQIIKFGLRKLKTVVSFINDNLAHIPTGICGEPLDKIDSWRSLRRRRASKVEYFPQDGKVS